MGWPAAPLIGVVPANAGTHTAEFVNVSIGR
jgi:hypothetical protein